MAIDFPAFWAPQRRCTAGANGPTEWRSVGHKTFFSTKEDAKECVATFRRESLPELAAITQFRIIKVTASDLEAA